MFTVKSSVTGTFWHIMRDGSVVHGAPKRGHGTCHQNTDASMGQRSQQESEMKTYTLEYRFLGNHEDPSWLEVDTFDHGYDARDAYWDHIKEFKHAQCRIS